MIDPVALFITWTTYGTWLPGDERGYVSNTLQPEGGFVPKENRPGMPYTADDAFTRERARSLQKWPTIWLTAQQGLVVATSLVKVSVQRGWMILRAAVMSNHVHVLLTDCPLKGEAARRILKGNTQTDLSTSVGKVHRWWTLGGSDRTRVGVRSILATTEYVADQPGKLAEVIENVVVVPGSDCNERRG